MAHQDTAPALTNIQSLQVHYQKMWQHSANSIATGNVDIDPLIADSTDNRRGITLLARIDSHINNQLNAAIAPLQQLAPEQYYYPNSDRHITLLSIISCEDGFTLNKVNIDDYIVLIEQCLKNIPALNIEFKGVTASPAAILAQGYPRSETLTTLRQQLRQQFKASSLMHSIDARYTLQTAHCTLMRFQSALVQSQAFMAALQPWRQQYFGRLAITQIELVFNDWYQRQSQCLHKFKLGKSVQT
ncbi:2'-5' RNA ligase family protein [Alteromonadaceae bacterium BrNp21-10]|nr:2'-5' RNA ligase family protein [Alteromonadaceae bacterium BrNp21-10]